jgi:hypothetical protein
MYRKLIGWGGWNSGKWLPSLCELCMFEMYISTQPLTELAGFQATWRTRRRKAQWFYDILSSSVNNVKWKEEGMNHGYTDWMEHLRTERGIDSSFLQAPFAETSRHCILEVGSWSVYHLHVFVSLSYGLEMRIFFFMVGLDDGSLELSLQSWQMVIILLEWSIIRLQSIRGKVHLWQM